MYNQQTAEQFSDECLNTLADILTWKSEKLPSAMTPREMKRNDLGVLARWIEENKSKMDVIKYRAAMLAILRSANDEDYSDPYRYDRKWLSMNTVAIISESVSSL